MRKFLKRFPFKKVFVYLFILLYTFSPSLHAAGVTLENDILENTEIDESEDILNEGISDPEWIAKPLYTYEDGIYTVDLVQEGQYTYPDNEDVRVMFTSVTEEGNLTINKVALSEKEKIELNTTDDYAWEITSTMSNGSFEYNLTLPNTLASTDVEVIYTEDGEVYESIDNVEVNEGVIYIEGLDHFTIFVVVDSGKDIDLVNCNLVYNPVDTTNCYRTIQEAITSSTDGDTIYVGEGTYVENIVIDKSITLIGKGEGKTILEQAENNYLPIIKITANDVTVENFTIQKARSIFGAVSITSSGNTIKNNLFLNNQGEIEIAGEEANLITGNTFKIDHNYSPIDPDRWGIYITNSSRNRIENNNISGPFYGDWGGWGPSAISISINAWQDTPKTQENIVKYNNFHPYGGLGLGVINEGEGENNKLDARENWWGHISGPSGEGGGSGDAVSSNVLFQEWLCEPYRTDWVSENGMCNLNNVPEQVGYRVNDGTENVLPVRYKCEGEYTRINGMSIHWVDVANGNPNIHYQRQYSKNGISWEGSEIYSMPYTGYKSFGYGEVTHFSRVRAFYDINGNKQYDSGEPVSDWSNTCSITYDKTPPEVTLVSPEDNFYTNKGSFSQSWTSEDTDISSYEYRSCSNNPISNESCDVIYLAPPQTSTSRTVNNNNITFWWQVRATDYAGNIGTWSNPRKATMDSKVPTVKITSHTEGQFIRGTQTISGLVEDQNLSHYWFVIHDLNGEQVQGQNTVYHNGPKVEPSFVWNTNNVSDGEYTIKLEARDLANNKGEDSIHWVNVVVDNTPPAKIEGLTIFRGHNSNAENELHCNSYTSDTQIRVQWTSGSEDDISNYWFGTKFNTTHKKISSLTNYYDANITPGHNPYHYTVIAEDKAGNRSTISEKCSITLDTEGPLSQITSPSNGFITNQKMNIEGNTDDNHSVQQVTLSYTQYNAETEQCEGDWEELDVLENKEVKLPFNWSYGAWPPEDGIYCIKAQGTDLAGNIENTSIVKNIIYDTEEPTNLLYNLINGVLEQVTADGGLSGLESIEVKVGDGEWEEYKEGMNLNDMANRTPGTHIVRIKVKDRAGNEIEIQRTFTIPAPFSDTLGEVLGALTEPFTPQPVQAQTRTSATTQLLAQSTQEEELPETEVETETEQKEEIEDIQLKEVKSEDGEEEEKEGLKWWIYILILFPLIFFFFILYKRRKEEEEKQL